MTEWEEMLNPRFFGAKKAFQHDKISKRKCHSEIPLAEYSESKQGMNVRLNRFNN